MLPVAVRSYSRLQLQLEFSAWVCTYTAVPESVCVATGPPSRAHVILPTVAFPQVCISVDGNRELERLKQATGAKSRVYRHARWHQFAHARSAAGSGY